MKRKNKKYVVLLLTILIFATAIVFGISYLRNHRIVQPQGSYMEKEQAEHLINVLAQKTGTEVPAVVSGNGEGENAGQYVTYGMYQEYIDQFVQANLIDQGEADTYKTKYDNKYKKEHFFLEEDFLEAYLKLSEGKLSEDAVCAQHVTMLLGGDRVIRLEDGSALSGRQILTEEARVYGLSLAGEKEEAELTGSGFLEVDCLADKDYIYYIRGKKEASLTLTGCFIANNEQFLEGYWGDYCLLMTNDTDYERMEDIVDCVITEGILSEVIIYQNKVHGKILSLGENFVELSMEDGSDVKYDFSGEVKAYKLFGAAKEQPDGGALQGRGYAMSDLKVGYDFTDFVLNGDNRVVAALATREEAMDNIRVLIKNNEFAGVYHDSISIQCDTNVTLKSGEVQKEYQAGETVQITPECGLFGTDRIFVKPAALTGRISITSLNRSQGTPAYRGILEIVRTDDGMYCVNELLLEEYLYSVVPSEMPSSYPGEAQKAQAISARTYAYQHMVKSTLQKFGAHVDDSTSYQVYNNIMETGAATEAVRETSGEIAMIGGEVAGTYFYSTSCGFGTDISVWHTDSKENTAHLKAKAIAAKPSFTPEEMTDEEKFREYITKKYDGDFESEEGWYRWSYTTALSGERLLSNLQNRYDTYPKEILTKQPDGSFASEPIDDLGEITQIAVNKRLAGGVIDELDFVGTKKTVRVISERNVRYVLANEADSVKRQSGDESRVSTMIPSAFAIINQTVDENGIVTGYEVIGGGYGHGIGLSQNGAKGMAQAGYTCEEIMQFFYEGVVLQNINSD